MRNGAGFIATIEKLPRKRQSHLKGRLLAAEQIAVLAHHVARAHGIQNPPWFVAGGFGLRICLSARQEVHGSSSLSVPEKEHLNSIPSMLLFPLWFKLKPNQFPGAGAIACGML
jgi:hypothetical protein